MRWEPYPERKESVQVTLKPAEPLEIKVFPNALFYTSGSHSRSFVLRNTGGIAVVVKSIHAPIGFVAKPVDGSAEQTLVPAGPPVKYVLERTDPDAKPGELVVFGTKAGAPGSVTPAELALASVLPIVPISPPIRATRVIGVDFGTSNTSVVFRDTTDDFVKFLPGEDTALGERWPSAILVKGRSSADWIFGQAAIDGYLPGKHRLVNELKTYLRRSDEPCEEWLPECSKQRLLAWYLSELRRQVIEPFLAEYDGPVTQEVHFVFSLPVLDSGELADLQKLRLMEAIQAAGFGDPTDESKFSYPTEPECAAMFFLRQSRTDSSRFPFDDGDRILVFDSGGGTTDIALCTVKVQGNDMSLGSDIRQVGAYTPEGRRADPSMQFGGTTVTQGLGFITNKAKPDKLLPIALSEHQLPPEMYSEFDSTESAGLAPEDPDRYPYSRWYNRFKKMYERFEHAKLDLSNDSTISKSLLYAEGLYDLTEDLYVEREWLNQVVDVDMEPLIRSMIQDLFPDPLDRSKIRYAFAIGGNSNLAQVRKWLEPHFLNRMADLDRAERNLAVPGGAVFLYNTRFSFLPYDMWLVDEASGKELARFGSKAARHAPWEHHIPVSAGKARGLALYAQNGGDPILLERCRVANTAEEERQIPVRFQLEGRRLIVTAKAGAEWEELLDYAV